MATQQIPYAQTQTLSELVQQVLKGHPDVASFHGLPATLENFPTQMSVKSKHFSDEKRQILVESLDRQYKHLSPNVFTKSQINALKQASTFTVTTGHQLNLMGGPLYFL